MCYLIPATMLGTLVIGYIAAEIKLHHDGYGGPDWGDDV